MKFIPFLILIFLASCTSEIPDGGPCSYENFEEVVFLSNIEIDALDSMGMFEFSTAIRNSDEPFVQLTKAETRELCGDFINDSTLQDTSYRFVITGQRITSGSCQPTIIHKITRAR